MELFWAFGVAAALVFGVSANDRMEQGLPVLPQFTGFKPKGLLPDGGQIEEIYQPEIDSSDSYSSTPQTAYDPGVDEYVQKWVAGYESEQVGDQVDGYAPEALENKDFQPGNNLEIYPETTDTSSDVSTQGFHENRETFPENELETSNVGPVFTFESEDFDDDEFAVFCELVDLDDFNPKGRDVIFSLWGIKPGRNYSKAVTKRNLYADRKASV